MDHTTTYMWKVVTRGDKATDSSGPCSSALQWHAAHSFFFFWPLPPLTPPIKFAVSNNKGINIIDLKLHLFIFCGKSCKYNTVGEAANMKNPQKIELKDGKPLYSWQEQQSRVIIPCESVTISNFLYITSIFLTYY